MAAAGLLQERTVTVNVEEKITALELEGASYLLMGNILRQMPEHTWLDALATEGVFDEIPFAQENPSVCRGAELLRSWAAEYTQEGADLVYSDCMALLIGPGKPLAAPWESVYSEANEGLIFQQETVDVRKAYRAFGLQIDKLHHEPDDHIAYELEFVATLCARAAEALAGNSGDEAKTILDAKDAFFTNHLSTWAFKWCDLMDENAKTDFYRGIALLVRGFIDESLKAIA